MPLKTQANEQDIKNAFRDFIYRETNWKIYTRLNEYVGKTAERYEVFKAGYLAAKN